MLSRAFPLLLFVSMVPAQVPATRASPGISRPVASSSMLLVSDVDCDVSVDGDSIGPLPSGKPKKLTIGIGQHLVQARTSDGKANWRKTIDVGTGQVVVDIDLRDIADEKGASPKVGAAPAAHRYGEENLVGYWSGYLEWANSSTTPQKAGLRLSISNGQVVGKLEVVNSQENSAWQQNLTGSLDSGGGIEIFAEATAYRDRLGAAHQATPKVLRGKLVSETALEGVIESDVASKFRFNRLERTDESIQQNIAENQSELLRRVTGLVGQWRNVKNWNDYNNAGYFTSNKTFRREIGGNAGLLHTSTWTLNIKLEGAWLKGTLDENISYSLIQAPGKIMYDSFRLYGRDWTSAASHWTYDVTVAVINQTGALALSARANACSGVCPDTVDGSYGPSVVEVNSSGQLIWALRSESIQFVKQ